MHRSEVNEDAKIDFDGLDTNKDDKLSFDELFTAMLPADMDHASSLIDSDINELLRKLDHSGDGMISLKEALDGHTHLTHHFTHYEL